MSWTSFQITATFFYVCLWIMNCYNSSEGQKEIMLHLKSVSVLLVAHFYILFPLLLSCFLSRWWRKSWHILIIYSPQSLYWKPSLKSSPSVSGDTFVTSKSSFNHQLLTNTTSLILSPIEDCILRNVPLMRTSAEILQPFMYCFSFSQSPPVNCPHFLSAIQKSRSKVYAPGMWKVCVL